MKLRVGNKENACLNGEWGKHWPAKRQTAKSRRAKNKKTINDDLADK